MPGRPSPLAIMVVRSASPVIGTMARFGGLDRVPAGTRPDALVPRGRRRP